MEMLIHKDILVKKFKSFPRVEPIAIDSSALKQYQTCPRSYFFRYVLGYTSVVPAIYFTWGSAIHAFYEEAENTYEEFKNVDLSIGLGIQKAMSVWGKTKDAPADDKKWSHMTKANLANVLRHVALEWKKEKESGILTVTHSEMPFTLQLENGVWISGKMDALVILGGRYWVRDFKTTAKNWVWYKKDISPSDQFARYTKAARMLTGQNVQGVIVDVIIKQANEKPPQFERETVSYTREELEDWERSQLYWDKVLRIAREEDHYPMVERACAFCQFRDVCTSRGESAQVYMLKAKYKFEVWDNAKSEKKDG